ncbi:SDR family NAD(P)-dependent oxidoreductase [Methylobacterium isbiliense]|jgi:short-subunit dehydrogenase|uniref:7-beta-hydroxysteroid dehydrogenase (NADP(+)) n=1 Tax=Methylobacterium isbiliense TaxID=315478 RepID=A0ABQ4SLN4_9HYPH|nr:SDR family oxidoreductase [Methylobacterium isbiliense]MDN3625887.1 SDR family oxidoreductase [Methylobacterium isbiliense]GJE02601.1 7-beta-hydroxysteroid dehydrogenase (NADP(+)) [Methylobacterium isbiliense]
MSRAVSPQGGSSALRDRYGPAALVTGASDGIGRAFARRLAGAGLDLVLVARREAVLADLARELQDRHGIAARVLAADLSDAAQVECVVRASADLEIGLLVAAAGFGTSGPFVEGDPGTELAMIDVNCRALAQLTHTFARRFVARGRGGIVLMSSLVAFQGVARAANYAATKAYVQTLAEGLHAELRPRGIDVLASAPGPVLSGFGQRAAMRITSGATPEEVAAATLRALGRSATVRPGLLAKALELSLKPLPRSGRVHMMGRVMAGMTAR